MPATRYVRGIELGITCGGRYPAPGEAQRIAPKPDSERELSTRRDTEHRGAFGGQLDAEARSCPATDILDEELLVCREPLRIKARRVLMEPQRLVGQPVYTDDHRGRHVGRLERSAPR